jgi:hypothetical protein
MILTKTIYMKDSENMAMMLITEDSDVASFIKR